MMKHIKSFICTLLSVSMLVSLCGCGNGTDYVEENIELLDPVGVTTEYATVTRQNFQDSKVYGGVVVPKVSEISFNSSQMFLAYGSLPGNQVKKGDAVVLASTDSLDEQIKNLKKTISDSRDNFAEQIKESDENIAKIKADVALYEQVNNNLNAMNDKDIAEYGIDLYNKQVPQYKLLLAQATAKLQRAQESIKETTELYELDSSFNEVKLKQLNNHRKNLLATASMDGTVVAINYYDKDNWIEKEASVAAIGDLSQLEIKTEFVIKNDVKRAADLYAMVNGKRYEVEYQAIEADEYNRLLAKNDVVYSTFKFYDPEHEIKAGDFATIVLIKNSREDVLTVPKDAINKDEEGTFVYKYEGDSAIYTPVKTGVTYGYYTEVLSGLNEGDRVVSQFKISTKKKTDTLKKGSFLHEFTGTGYLFYPKREAIKNPIEYGVTYIQELCVANYQLVNKGDVIAKIKVSPDSLEIERQERNLLRANEELAKLKKNNTEGKNDKLIKYKEESIEEITKLINHMKSDAATTEIRAPFTGIITGTMRWEEGNIIKNNEWMAELADESNSFVVVEDSAGQLTYGNVATISYEDADGVDKVVTGEVITVSSYALSKALKTGYALIKVAPEDLANMAGSSMGYEGWWNRNRFKISVYSRSSDNVVLVPKNSVKREGDATYVTVLDENNEPEYISFVAGGSDSFYYWVAEGLTEGTVICLE